MKKEKNAAKPKTKRPAKPKKEPVSQWMTNPLNEQVLDYHNYEMTQGEQVLYFILAFLIGGVVSQFFYGGLFQEDGAPTLLTYISNAAAFVVVGLIAGRVFLPVRSRKLAEKRRDVLRKQFRDMLESITASLAANSTVRDAFNAAYTDMCMQYIIFIQEELLMNNFMNKLYVKALVTANMAKNELKKMCEEDEGMDIIVTIVLVALGIVIVGVVARIASDVIGKADQQVSGLDSTFAQLK